MMKLKYDVHSASMNKANEMQCGDVVEVEQQDSGIGVLLVDGLGSGFTASLHAGMTAKLIKSMVSRGEDIISIIDTVAGNMEKNSSRMVDYCTFTLMLITSEGALTAAMFNMPEPVILRHGKPIKQKTDSIEVGQRHVKTVSFQLMPYDTVAVFSDGVIKAGIGASLNLGLGQKSVVSYLTAAYKPHISSEKLVNLLLAVCNSLYLGKPGDDMSAVVIRAQKEKPEQAKDVKTVSGTLKPISTAG